MPENVLLEAWESCFAGVEVRLPGLSPGSAFLSSLSSHSPLPTGLQKHVCFLFPKHITHLPRGVLTQLSAGSETLFSLASYCYLQFTLNGTLESLSSYPVTTPIMPPYCNISQHLLLFSHLSTCLFGEHLSC